MNLFYHRNMFHTSHNTNELLMYLLRMGSPIRDAICKHLLPLTIIELRFSSTFHYFASSLGSVLFRTADSGAVY